MKCANCERYLWSNETVFHSKYGYLCYICKQCSERENMSNIKITAEVDGKQVLLRTISTESFEAIKALEKPKEIPVPVARVGHYRDCPSNRRLFLKITNNIRENVARKNADVIAINLGNGCVNNTWRNSNEADNLKIYDNIKPL